MQGTYCGWIGLDTQERASLENPSVSPSDPAAWNEIFGSDRSSESGQVVNESKSLNIAAVWQCVSMISGDIAKLPLDLYRRTGDDGREIDKSQTVWRVVRRQPNQYESANRFWRTLMVHALIWNNAWAWIQRDGRGNVTGMQLLLPDRTNWEQHSERGRICVSEIGGKLETFYHDEIFHVCGISICNGEGEKFVKHARDAFGLSLARQGFASRFFKHGGRTGGILQLPLGTSRKASDALEEGFRRTYDDPNAQFKTVIARDGAKFMQAQQSPHDAQMVEAGEQSVREIARFFNVAPSRVGLSDSVSYNSKAEDNQSYLDTTLSPWLEDIAAEAWLKLLTPEQQAADSHYFEHNSKVILKLNPLQQAQAHKIAVDGGWLTVNEVRKHGNMKPLDGGDVPRGQVVVPKQVNTSRARVIFEATNLARKKAERPNAFIEMLDGGMPQLRARAVEVTGSDAVVVELLSALKRAETATKDDLSQVVEDICTEFEKANL